MTACSTASDLTITRNGRSVLPLCSLDKPPISAPMVVPMVRQADHLRVSGGVLARLGLVLVLAGSSLVVALDAKSTLDADQARRVAVAVAEAARVSSEAQPQRRHVARPSYDIGRAAAFAASRHLQTQAAAEIH
jgi:hypothetical protein